MPNNDYSMSEKTSSREDISLSARLEALLFVAPGAVSLTQLASALDISTKEVEQGLKELEEEYQQRGLRLQWHAGRVQLTTAPEAAPWVERLLGLESSTRLSQAALEVLAIIAYKQPVTRPEVDAIRGVNSDTALKSLLSKGLIEEVGRSERPGRPILYATTAEFLQHFGLNSLEELPPLPTNEEGTKE
jgi:segregation and condensation protein B